jgi:hypothetical protein
MKAIHESGWGEPASQRVPCTIPNGGYPNSLPDITDPATIGCLLDLVRKAWDMSYLVVDTNDILCEKWHISIASLNKVFTGSTEAEALILALEASNA